MTFILIITVIAIDNNYNACYLIYHVYLMSYICNDSAWTLGK